MQHIEDAAQFDASVMTTDTPVLVDFWAPWCGPCKTLKPIIGEIAEDYAGRMTVALVNAEDLPDLATRFGVRGLPTLMVVKAGEIAAMRTGAAQKGQLSKWIDEAIS